MTRVVDIQEQLALFGLSEIEIKIYLYVLHNPPMTMLDLSRQLNIPRTSIYDNTERLVEKGLLEKVTKQKSQQVIALPVEMLKSVLESKKNELDTLEKAYTKIEKHLKLTLDPSGKTEILYYQGKEGLQQMMWNSLKATDRIVGYSVFGRINVVGKNFQKQYTQECKKRGITDYVIINPMQSVYDLITNHVKPYLHHLTTEQIRVIPRNELRISGDTMIYNTTVAFSDLNGNTTMGFEVENPEYSNIQRSIFDLLWKTAQPYNSGL